MSEEADAPDTEDPGSEAATSAVVRQAHVGLLAAYRRLPGRLKRLLVGWTTPSFQVAAGVVLQRADGAILLVKHTYRRGWGIPGGLLKRDEHPSDAAAREATEELGIDVEMHGEPLVIIEPEERRVLVAFTARWPDGHDEGTPSPRSPEIAEAVWFLPDELPCLQPDVAKAIAELRRLPRPRSA